MTHDLEKSFSKMEYHTLVGGVGLAHVLNLCVELVCVLKVDVAHQELGAPLGV